MASTSKLTTTISSSPSLKILCRKLPFSIHLPSSSSSLSPRLTLLSNHPYSPSRRFSLGAQNDNVADSHRHYDFDLFTIGAGSGGVFSEVFSQGAGSGANNNCSSSSENTPKPRSNRDTNEQANPDHLLRVLPDFAQLYSFIGSVFDPYASNHLQKLKKMDPIDVEMAGATIDEKYIHQLVKP
ncbi:hypothetical protein Bca101_059209 [Brassica carinata]